ncbi:cupredoxin domain-containing protein [Candidatus Nitrosocosmicus sp. T]
MKLKPLFLVAEMMLVATLVNIEVYNQNIIGQQVPDDTAPMSNNVTISPNEKIQVSIVSEATFLTDTAYYPNPVEVNVDQTVLWTNEDFSFHTVTSGDVSDTNSVRLFDSGLAGPGALSSTGKTYEYTFKSAGEYPYYCILHPGMVGKVIVTE